MNRSIRRRLRALEARFPPPPLDFSQVSNRDLEALERHFEQMLAQGTSDGIHLALPLRLQKLISRP
jgi:hypothetical protein